MPQLSHMMETAIRLEMVGEDIAKVGITICMTLLLRLLLLVRYHHHHYHSHLSSLHLSPCYPYSYPYLAAAVLALSLLRRRTAARAYCLPGSAVWYSLLPIITYTSPSPSPLLASLPSIDSRTLIMDPSVSFFYPSPFLSKPCVVLYFVFLLLPLFKFL